MLLLRRYTLFALITLTSTVYGQGFRFTTPEEYARIDKASIELLKDVPDKHDLSKWFPEPGDQGMQASCVGWALAYGIKSYQEAIEHQRPPEGPENTFSPAFIYNQINRWGCQGGSNIREALELMQTYGVSTMERFPYDENNCTTSPTAQAAKEAKNFTIAGWKRVEFMNEGLMKTLLVDGKPVVIGMQTDSWFRNLDAGEVYRVASYEGVGGHAVVVVGYDDRKGAYKIFNSWGDDWGDSGYGWIAYDLFEEVVVEAYIVEDTKTESNKTVKGSQKTSSEPSEETPKPKQGSPLVILPKEQ